MKSGIDFRSINRYISQHPAVKKACRAIVENKMEISKLELVNNFQSHPVSQEISAGPGAANSSGTLKGYGNLFSFIGFNSGDDPVNRWVNFIKRHLIVRGNPKVTGGENSFNIVFEIPNISEVELLENSPMPWESGRSWISGIERGISGFSNYISKQISGRSGGGLQSKYNARSAQFARTRYWTSMWKDFIRNINK